MDNTFWIIVGLGIAFWLGKHYAQLKFLHKISVDPDSMIKLLQQVKQINEEETDIVILGAIEVKTEQVNDAIYAYNKTTGEFLAQANDLHQVMTEAAKRFPEKKFWHPELTQDTRST
jgi:heptaprenylglyceryl phosphate synthase